MSEAGSKRIARGLAAAALVGAVLCPPAGAKNPGGGARAMMNRFAACAVQRRPDFARSFVLAPAVRPSSADLEKVAPPECLRRAGEDIIELQMRDTLYRGALAEQLIRVELSGAAIIDPSLVPALEWPEPERPSTVDEHGRALAAAAQKQREHGYAVAVADQDVMRLGECVVRADPGGSRDAVLTEMDSPNELARLRAMAPTIARCVARGQTSKFNRTTLRAALAVSYYRLAAAARALRTGGA
ncbi:MAG: hypothetical protein QOJ94_3130 [Sphingomonadales bacterium]|jgi:hypothetical protein|nr:hypothetical protein [Sphingomonadales bacterium]